MKAFLYVFVPFLVIIVVVALFWDGGPPKTVGQRIEDECAASYPPKGSLQYDQCSLEMTTRYLADHAKQKADDTYNRIR